MNTDVPELAPRRLTSLDAYRGFVMALMMGEALNLGRVAKARPNVFWNSLAFHQSHVEWVGCSLHDMIQPSFSFLVGVALPFSLASRSQKGQTQTAMTLHAIWRSFVLVALGIFLRSMGRDRTNFTFEDTLTQIGLGYTFLFLIGLRPLRDAWIALATILVITWAAFALYPLPGPEFDYASVGVPPDWPHLMSGFAAHWNKNSNLAWAFDVRFLNLFPREKPFQFNGGGYATLSFVPTLATMILGQIAGKVLRSERSSQSKLAFLTLAGLVSLAAGAALGASGICPVVKRIWTPSWVLFSGGWCFLMLASFYAITDVLRLRAWAFPLVVIGANSIAAYLMAHVLDGFVAESYRVHLGRDIFKAGGPHFEPLLQGTGVLLVLWLLLFQMYRKRIFLKI